MPDSPADTESLDEYDPTNDETFESTYAVFGELRARCPVAHSTAFDGFWAVTRYQDIHDILMQPRPLHHVGAQCRAGLVDHRTQTAAASRPARPHALSQGDRSRARRAARVAGIEEHDARMSPARSCSRSSRWAKRISSSTSRARCPPRCSANGSASPSADAGVVAHGESLREGLGVVRQEQRRRRGGAARRDGGGSDRRAAARAARSRARSRRARCSKPATNSGQPFPEALLAGCVRQVLVVGLVAPPILLGSIAVHLSRDVELQEQLRDDLSLVPGRGGGIPAALHALPRLRALGAGTTWSCMAGESSLASRSHWCMPPRTATNPSFRRRMSSSCAAPTSVSTWRSAAARTCAPASRSRVRSCASRSRSC